MITCTLFHNCPPPPYIYVHSIMSPLYSTERKSYKLCEHFKNVNKLIRTYKLKFCYNESSLRFNRIFRHRAEKNSIFE